ncbi:(2Fe-2S)-binding protein [Ornithinimicrobium panacihumi]|uniref:(2Fe-2S)-binding protein n=1 Tax=Ornithinimicrobium panacihumi TaxID=2008449 RepID=UPI003F89E96B
MTPPSFGTRPTLDTRPTFDLDGRAVPFVPGQTLGAALVAQGTLAWRTTRRDGRPRGIFCGIGVCFDCLVSVDGVPDQRACRVPAEEGQDVRTSQGDLDPRDLPGEDS